MLYRTICFAIVTTISICTQSGVGLAHGTGNNSFQTQPNMCGCNPLPVAGTYSGPVNFELSHEGGNANACPTQLRIRSPERHRGPKVNAVLTCDASTQLWTGVETGVPIKWELRGTPIQEFPGTFAIAESVDAKIILPPAMKAIGKADRAATFVATSGRAAPCICEIVKGERDYVQDRIAVLSDLALLSYAQANGYNGVDERLRFYMDDKRRLQPVAGRQARSYEDLVDGVMDGTVTIGPNGAITIGTGAPVQSQANASNTTFGSLQPTALAQTNPESCKIQMQSAAENTATCTPDIVARGARVHEEQHANKCKALHTTTTYIATDGKKIDWVADRDMNGFVYYKGVVLPRSGYQAWNADPFNHSNGEVGAYTEELNVLNGWLGKYCP